MVVTVFFTGAECISRVMFAYSQQNIQSLPRSTAVIKPRQNVLSNTSFKIRLVTQSSQVK